MKFTHIKTEPCKRGDIIIHFQMKPNWFEWLCGWRSEIRAYRGSCTVWNNIHTGNSTRWYKLIDFLLARWKLYEWEKADNE